MVVISHADPKEYIGLVACLSVKVRDFMHFFLRSKSRSMVFEDVYLCKFV